jgi:hypothetical protein
MDTKKAKKNVLEAYEKTLGNVSASCQSANISRRTFYKWKDADPKFKEALEDVDERNIDLAESKLMAKIRDGSTPELIFFLKTKGKKRGYVEKIDYSLQLERPIFNGIDLED